MSSFEIVQYWGAVDYKPSLRFYDAMYKAANEVKGQLDYWSTDRLQVTCADRDDNEMLHLNHQRTRFEGAVWGDTAHTQVPRRALRLARFVDKALCALPSEPITRIGYKMAVYADLRLSAQELIERLRPYCLPRNDRVDAVISSELVDVDLLCEFVKDRCNLRLQVGPMTRKQAMRTLRASGKLEELFPPAHESDSLASLYARVPEVALYVDLDIFRNSTEDGDIRRAEWIPHVQQAADQAVEVFAEFEKLILGID